MVYWNFTELFEELNAKHFGGFLIEPGLRWNSRLSSSAGRFLPGVRRGPFSRPPIIEIATYLRDQPNARECLLDTMGHEMIHYWLWARRRPYGHTPEFYEKMREMGVSRYNTIGQRRPYKHLYACGHCGKDFPSRRLIGVRACGVCCNRFNGGKFDRRFTLQYLGDYRSVISEREALGEKPGASEKPADTACFSSPLGI